MYGLVRLLGGEGGLLQLLLLQRSFGFGQDSNDMLGSDETCDLVCYHVAILI